MPCKNKKRQGTGRISLTGNLHPFYLDAFRITWARRATELAAAEFGTPTLFILRLEGDRQ